jgi:hypothetical protein
MFSLIRGVLIAGTLAACPACFAQDIWRGVREQNAAPQRKAQASADQGDTYSNPTIGFSIRKPGEWHYVTAEQYLENVKRGDFNDPKFKEMVARYASTPFLSIAKHKVPYEGINPGINVKTREAGNLKGMVPEKIAELSVSGLPVHSGIFPLRKGWCRPIQAIPPAVRVNFTYEAGGVSAPIASELWIVPRGDLIFMIGASTRQDEKSGTRSEVRSIINTIKIE